jgi:predicted nuclease of predicted toxin-antitoxin system
MFQRVCLNVFIRVAVQFIGYLRGVPGITDQQVITRAKNEGRIIVTFDSDYGVLGTQYLIQKKKCIRYRSFFLIKNKTKS